MSLNCDLDDRETHRDLFACPWGYFPPEHPWSDHEARGVKCGVASSLVFWIEDGLLPDPEGRPVAVEVLAGNPSDPVSFKTAVSRVRDDFGITSMIMAGDRGMITGTRIDDLRKLEGTDWITSLRATGVPVLAADDGPP